MAALSRRRARGSRRDPLRGSLRCAGGCAPGRRSVGRCSGGEIRTAGVGIVHLQVVNGHSFSRGRQGFLTGSEERGKPAARPGRASADLVECAAAAIGERRDFLGRVAPLAAGCAPRRQVADVRPVAHRARGHAETLRDVGHRKDKLLLASEFLLHGAYVVAARPGAQQPAHGWTIWRPAPRTSGVRAARYRPPARPAADRVSTPAAAATTFNCRPRARSRSDAARRRSHDSESA